MNLKKKKSKFFECIEQASPWHEIYSHDMEVMSSTPGFVKPGLVTKNTKKHQSMCI